MYVNLFMKDAHFINLIALFLFSCPKLSILISTILQKNIKFKNVLKLYIPLKQNHIFSRPHSKTPYQPTLTTPFEVQPNANMKIVYNWFLLLNQIKAMSQQIDQKLFTPDLQDVKKRLFTDCTPNHEQYDHYHNILLATPQRQTQSRKIQLKRNLKTEANPVTPYITKESHLKTSPNKYSPLTCIQESKVSTFRPQTSTHIKYPNADFYSLPQPQQQNNSLKSSFRQLLPSSQRNKLSHSRTYRNAMQKRSKEKTQSINRASLSKSRKKMMFTIYDSKKKASTDKKYLQKQDKSQYSVPYRYESSITITLFESRVSNRSLSTKKGKNTHSISPYKKDNLNQSNLTRNLAVTHDQRITRTLMKLQSYKFVFEYIKPSDVIERLKTYAFRNQPQCKWALLIVDEIFKKKKKPSNTNSYR